MHFLFIAHTSACQMYVTVTYTTLKCVLHLITWMIVLIRVLLWMYSEGWTTWSKRVFSKRYMFPCYRVSQSRVSTRRSPFTTCIKRIVISVYLNSVYYLISYTRLFMKLNLCEIFFMLHLLQWKFPDLQ